MVNFQNYFDDELKRWFVFEAVGRAKKSQHMFYDAWLSPRVFKRDKTLLLACFKHYINVYINA